MQVIAWLVGITVGAAVVLGIWFGIWSLWEWVTPLSWHVANFWKFAGILLLLGIVVAYVKSWFSPEKVSG